jgi:hypothetical protein
MPYAANSLGLMVQQFRLNAANGLGLMLQI